MESGMQMTSQKLSQKNCQKQTVTVLDSLARVLALPESEVDSKIQEELCSLRSCDWLKPGSLSYYSPKMLRDFLATTEEEHSESSSIRWMSWGMMSHGRCLTAKISEFPKTGKGCSLLDILEKQVPKKYFLSGEQLQKIVFKS